MSVVGVDYYFPQSLFGFHDPVRGTFQVPQLAFVEGRGADPDAARADWQLGFHVAFQHLVFTRDFELDAGQQRQKRILERLVDVARYMNTTPCIVDKIGRVVRYQRYPQRIEWVDGGSFAIDYERVSAPELGRMRMGQWLRTTVKVQRRTGAIVEMLAVSAIDPPKTTTEAVWDEIEPTKAPKSDKAWT